MLPETSDFGVFLINLSFTCKIDTIACIICISLNGHIWYNLIERIKKSDNIEGIGF